eukprot:TRINITY_DN2161_c0_g2_i2.p1 TRINITY_DN2161_c0_g2~~TRINITY_DN2161_c0_g2_i2.p1  ORF type:complete len:479 (+),score=131.04 TRINITY_DN2161_c0_g2_i2:193-1629(+)
MCIRDRVLGHKMRAGLYGYDILVGSHGDWAGKYLLIDVNLFPGYKGLVNSTKLIQRHMINNAVDMALRQDKRFLMDLKMVEKLCLASLKRAYKNSVPNRVMLEAVESGKKTATVKCIKLGYNSIFTVTLPELVSCSGATLKVYGRGDFGANTSQNRLTYDLGEMGFGVNVLEEITATYYGETIEVGRIEALLPGTSVTQLMEIGNALFEDSTFWAPFGWRMAQFHQIVSKEEFMRLHFDDPSSPCIISRMSEWRKLALNLVSDSKLSKAPQWSELFQGFTHLQHVAEELVKVTNAGLKSAPASALVLGHFDVNTGNIMVEFNGNNAEVHLIDFEWAGPNIAAYDFAKFMVSMYISMQRGLCTLSMDGLMRGLERWVGSYLAATSQLCPKGSIQYAAQASDVEASSVQAFVRDVLAYTPVCAAANFFSNLIHSYHAGQLSNIPEQTSLLLDNGDMSWLAHAQSHLAAYFYFRAQSTAKL